MGWFQVASGRIYADDGRALNVLDATTGAIRARLPPTNFGFWFL
jgi:hypothetical protein